MLSCDLCDATILWGGVKNANTRYCDAKCANAAAYLRTVREAIPPHVLASEIAAVHNAPCPRCTRPARIDYYHVHSIWSLIILTKISRTQVRCCRRCARKHQAFQHLGSMLVGWWSIPFGPIATLIQIARNIAELSKRESPEPSRRLVNEVISKLGQQLAQPPRS